MLWTCFGFRLSLPLDFDRIDFLRDCCLSTKELKAKSEDSGSKARQYIDGILKIPMVGFTESLNISVSAAIIIQSLTNRLRYSEVNWQLTDEEILEKRLDWTRKSIKVIDFIERKFFEG